MKQRIIELYIKCHSLHDNDVKRVAHINLATGISTREIVKAVLEYQETLSKDENSSCMC